MKLIEEGASVLLKCPLQSMCRRTASAGVVLMLFESSEHADVLQNLPHLGPVGDKRDEALLSATQWAQQRESRSQESGDQGKDVKFEVFAKRLSDIVSRLPTDTPDTPELIASCAHFKRDSACFYIEFSPTEAKNPPS
nr:hypothetical protein [uncultured Rhodoferax sp.]